MKKLVKSRPLVVAALVVLVAAGGWVANILADDSSANASRALGRDPANTTPGGSMMPVDPKSTHTLPVPLFHAELDFESESPEDAVVPADGRQGAYIGTSSGTISGDKLSGRIRASYYSANCSYPLIRAQQRVPDALHLCTVNPGMIIETQDGAVIRVDGNGYGLRTPQRYRVSASLVFGTEDPRYTWLTTTIAWLEGELDEKTGRSTWKVYLPEG